MRKSAFAPAKLQRYRRFARPAAFGLCALGAACGSANRSSRTQAAKTVAPAVAVQVVHPARLFVLPEHAQVGSATELPDGTRQIVARGMRLLDHADGSLERARDVFPGRGTPRSVALPERLGGGYLFAVEAAGGTDVWRAPSFTGALTPLARLSFEVEQLVAGFDRLYVIERRTRDVAALDVESGRIIDAGPLPAAPGYASLAFANAWFGAVQVPFRGVMVSFDAGASWNPLPLSSPGLLTLDAGELTVITGEGSVAIDQSGGVRPHVPAPAATAASDTTPRAHDGAPAPGPATAARPLNAERVAYGVLGRRPLVDAVLHGVAEAPGTALVAANGALARVRLSDGKLLESRERVYPGTSACHGVPLEAGHGFVCGEEGGGTAIYRLRAFALEPVLAFEDARVVSPSGNGALVVGGPCSGRAHAPGLYCVRTRSGQMRQIHWPGALGTERVVALLDGRIAVVEPPRPDAAGSLTLLAAHGPGRIRMPLSFAGSTRSTTALLRKGLWMNGFVEDAAGALLGWVAAAGPFAGVRVHLDGRVEVAPAEHDMERALLAGPLGIVFGGTRLAAQTIDHGFTWREIELPSDWVSDDNARRAELAGREQGCSPLGCVFGAWLRVGWHARNASTALLTAPQPPKVGRVSPGGGRWQLRCAPTGELLRAQRATADDGEADGTAEYTSPLAPPAARRARAQAAAAPRGRGWPGLFELAPPARAADEPAFHVGTEHKPVQVHGYVWGSRATSWDRGGKWQVYVADPFMVQGAWSTLVTRSPWADATVAAQAFGADPTGSSSWDAVLDPLARAGALTINSRGTLELFLLEDERGIVSVRDAGRHGFFSLAGVVKLGQTWYIGAEAGSQTFRILRVEAGRASVLAEYPLYQLGRSGLRASVVRSSADNRLGVWVRGGGYYVFPVNTGNGSLGAPLEIPPAELARTPRACAADANGWVLKTLPSETSRDLLEPHIDAGETRLRNLEARLIVGAAGVCLDALAAQAERSNVVAKKVTLPPDRLSAPLIASERRVGGQRWGLRCAP